MTGYLDVEARIGGEFLHPGGVGTTRMLISWLALDPGDLVLEIGCGTGATAALAARQTGVNVCAVDQSLAMLRSAHSRLVREGLQQQVQLAQVDANRPLPFPDAAFGAVYAESVVALLDVERVCRECARILRPGGRVAFTERIWKSDVPASMASEVNAISRRVFGIPAATDEPLDRLGWIALLERAGFSQVRAIHVDSLLTGTVEPVQLGPRITRWHRRLAHPQTIRDAMRFRAAIRRHKRFWAHLESYMFLARMLD